MALSPDDRKSFSLKIVSADSEIGVYVTAKAQLAGEVDKLQKLDNANKNLFDPTNARVNQYQLEMTALDGLTRSTFAEQNIIDAAGVKIGNYFYPNQTNVSVPSLAATNNVWTKPKPFALTYAIGKNYSEGQPVVTKEGDLVQACLALIASAGSFTTTQLTTGLQLSATGTCSNPSFTTQATCQANGGVWTAGPNVLTSFTAVQTLKTDLVAAVNALKSFLQTEVGYIVTNDSDNAIQTQNNAAINNINTVIIPALNTWLAYVDFNTTGVTAGNFNSINPATLAPTKLYTTQLTALQTALNTRLSFVTTRTAQVAAVLGTIVQDLNTGAISSSSGLYGRRYGFLLLRLDILNGSLSKLNSLSNANAAQDSIISSIKTNKATYLSVLPTSALSAPGNDTNMIQLVDVSYFSAGDTVYIMAENQQELQRAIKSINGKVVTLNDIVPAKYKTTDSLRIYKDIS